MNFDSDLCQKYVEELIRFDEVERALLVLENVPAHERDKLPPNLSFLKKQILGAICTPTAYMHDGLDPFATTDGAIDLMTKTLRGMYLKAEVERYNKIDKVPHIVDIGPGEYFIPIGLKALGLKFSYWAVGCDKETMKKAEKIIEKQDGPKEGQPTILAALEIIEHLSNTTDLVTECLRGFGMWPERIHLSTPCYTYDCSPKDWRKKSGLPHLRAYTPKEFHMEASRLFPCYNWQMAESPILSLRGQRTDCTESIPLL